MPPKAKFTREEIIDTALKIVRERGKSALTARELGASLGSSARPIFTTFKNMEEVQEETLKAARNVYNTYIERALSYIPAFQGVGLEYINFAKNEPKLFQLLFMAEQSQVPSLSQVLPIIDENYIKILNSAKDAYDLTLEHAKFLYQHMWIYSHGIATLSATGVCYFTAAEIRQMLTEVYISLIKNMKAGKKND